MPLADSHCHLDDSRFESERDEVIRRARAAGVKYMLAIGTGNGPPDLEAGLRLAEQHLDVFATAGVHPNDAEKSDGQTFLRLERLLVHPRIRALGEIGLDYHWGVPKDAQMPVFLRQLEMAKAAQVPVVIHTRDAWDDTLAVLRKHWAGSGIDCVMHCFTGNAEQARVCLDLGCTLAFGGVATFPNAAEVREAARVTPADRLLIETDAPYLAPVPFRGKRNEPAYVAYTVEALAKVRGVPVGQLGEETTRNFERLFQISMTSPS